MQSLPNFNGTFYRNRANHPNICIEPQRTPISQSDTQKGEQASRSLTSRYSRKPQSPKVWTWYKNRHVGNRNRTEGPELNPCGWGQLIYDKRAKDTPRGRTVTTISSAGKNGYHISHAGYTDHKTDENPVFNMKPFLGRMKMDRPSAVSRTQETSPHFSSPFPPGRKETQLQSAWTQSCVVLKLNPSEP